MLVIGVGFFHKWIDSTAYVDWTIWQNILNINSDNYCVAIIILTLPAVLIVVSDGYRTKGIDITGWLRWHWLQARRQCIVRNGPETICNNACCIAFDVFVLWHSLQPVLVLCNSLLQSHPGNAGNEEPWGALQVGSCRALTGWCATMASHRWIPYNDVLA